MGAVEFVRSAEKSDGGQKGTLLGKAKTNYRLWQG